jgi:hypothetical protein
MPEKVGFAPACCGLLRLMLGHALSRVGLPLPACGMMLWGYAGIMHGWMMMPGWCGPVQGNQAWPGPPKHLAVLLSQGWLVSAAWTHLAAPSHESARIH